MGYPSTKDTWIDWVVRIIPSQYEDGVIQVWRDGVLQVNQSDIQTQMYVGSRNTADKLYTTYAIYKRQWTLTTSNVTQRVCWFDSIRIAEGTGGYSLVDPTQDD